ncbi:aldo/keto reductase [Mycobacterium sp. URHB0021]
MWQWAASVPSGREWADAWCDVQAGWSVGPFGLQTDQDVAHQILDKAADAGVNFLDTADAYPMGSDLSLVGRTEQVVGDWLRGKRDRFIIATKAGVAMGPSSGDQGGSRKHLLDAIDGSLTRLGTDYVDLYQLHVDDRPNGSTGWHT